MIVRLTSAITIMEIWGKKEVYCSWVLENTEPACGHSKIMRERERGLTDGQGQGIPNALKGAHEYEKHRQTSRAPAKPECTTRPRARSPEKVFYCSRNGHMQKWLPQTRRRSGPPWPLLRALAQQDHKKRPSLCVGSLSGRWIFFFLYKDFVFNLEKRVKLQSWGR